MSKRLLLLLVLLAVDVVFIGLHVVHKMTALLPDPRFAISQDGGFSELFEYLEYATIIGALIYLCRIDFSWVYAVWAIIFGYLLIDDSFTIHELLGRQVGRLLGFVADWGLRPEDFGELAVSGVAGGVFAVLIAVAHVISAPPMRRTNLLFVGMLAALAFFGVVVDALHVIAGGESQMLKGAVGVIEDGGEMLVMSGIVYVVLGLCIRRGAGSGRAG